ncbi:MAG: DUF4160 domain-containing protein [Pseudomonadota bacterium]
MNEWSVQLTGDVADELRLSLDKASHPSSYIKQLIASLGAFKIEIFSREHPPPHFRVFYQGETNNFRIDNCDPINGDALSRYLKTIRKWHKNNKQHLIHAWNERRPSDCPAGKYQER